MLSSHCGKLEIDGHSSQFVVVFRERAVTLPGYISYKGKRQ